MTKDKKALAKLAASAETVGLDPVLKRQIEMELHAGYAFNAKTAKYGVVTVWIPRLLAIGAVIGALYCFVVALILYTTGTEIQAFDMSPPRGDFLIWAVPDEAGLYLGGVVLFTALFAFMRYILVAMKRAQFAATQLADQYKADTQ